MLTRHRPCHSKALTSIAFGRHSCCPRSKIFGCASRQTRPCTHQTLEGFQEGQGSKRDFWGTGDPVSGPKNDISSFKERETRLPTQGESLVKGIEPQRLQLQEREDEGPPDFVFLSELMAMQESGPRNLGFFGTRNMGFMHQNLIEVLSYAMVLTGNHIFTSGATGTNAAVIRGALRAEKPELLTVVLPQSLQKQPPESQDLLSQVKKLASIYESFDRSSGEGVCLAENLIDMPQNDGLSLGAASRICNRNIVNRVQQVICFAFHDSKLLLETCSEAKENHKAVTLFYLD